MQNVSSVPPELGHDIMARLVKPAQARLGGAGMTSASRATRGVATPVIERYGLSPLARLRIHLFILPAVFIVAALCRNHRSVPLAVPNRRHIARARHFSSFRSSPFFDRVTYRRRYLYSLRMRNARICAGGGGSNNACNITPSRIAACRAVLYAVAWLYYSAYCRARTCRCGARVTTCAERATPRCRSCLPRRSLFTYISLPASTPGGT